MIRCLNCDRSIEESETQCPHCGAKQWPRRVLLDPRPHEFTLTSEEPDDMANAVDDREAAEPEFPVRRAAATEPRPAESAPGAMQAVRWGGFFRRLVAFLLDAVAIVVLTLIMLWLSFIGYKVGLAGHARAVTWQTGAPLIFFTTWASIFLAAIYFVVFHGGEGKTIGKWLLGLRVVGPEQSPIGYRRAFFRWLVMVILAPLVLGFLWILWSSEKRGWHDYLARTWVIRE